MRFVGVFVPKEWFIFILISVNHPFNFVNLFGIREKTIWNSFFLIEKGPLNRPGVMLIMPG
jgi:hypothetical protein